MTSEGSPPLPQALPISAQQLVEAKNKLKQTDKVNITETKREAPHHYEIMIDQQKTKAPTPGLSGTKPAVAIKPKGSRTDPKIKPKQKQIHDSSPYAKLDSVYSHLDTLAINEDIWIVKEDFRTKGITLLKGTEVNLIDSSDPHTWTVEDEKQNKRANIPSYMLMKPSNLEKNQWYHGFITRDQAEQYLANTGQDGAFLIRAKDKDGHVAYVLSVQTVDDKGNWSRTHYEIKNPTQGDKQFYFINRGREFSSLEELVIHYSDNSDGLPTRLMYPLIEQNDYLEPISLRNPEKAERGIRSTGYTSGRPIMAVPAIPQRSQKQSELVGPVKPKRNPPTTDSVIVDSSSSIPQLDNKDGHDMSTVFHIDEDCITKVDKIGCGEFGEVFSGTLKQIDEKTIDIAIKYFNKNDDEGNKETLFTNVEFEKEIKVLMKIEHHPHLVRFWGYSKKINCIVMELMPKGDLKKYLKSKKSKLGKPKKEKFVKMAYQISDGMSYLESIPVVHRDLAARNILLGDKDIVKITDFGLSRKIENIYKATGGKLPVKWTAPEGSKKGEFTSKSDVWSFGMVLVEIFTLGDDPYKDMNKKCFTDLLVKNELPDHPKPDLCPDDLYEDIMKKCWRMNPSTRPSFGDVIKPYLKQYVEKLKRSTGLFR